MKLVTPRKIAWLVLLGLVSWFIISSPKTPPEFLAAANRQQEVDKQHLIAEFNRIDPVRGADAAKLLQLSTISDSLRYMELNIDYKLDRRWVNANRDAVLLGAYPSTQPTIDSLTKNSPEYQALLAKFDQLRNEIHDNKKYSSALLDLQNKINAASPKQQRSMRFVHLMQSMFWRRFQAMIFWPEINCGEST
ncbi:MAG: hypothetical protein LBH01_01745 [Verrucomicrobiales bacterium]|nr:hypothetical protein [Verrucomicrobiales bacterium]